MIINVMEQNWSAKNPTDLFLQNEKGEKAVPSEYTTSEDERNVISMVINSFTWADITMRKPRREYNDMSTLTRAMYDQMAFNIYQPNNGQPNIGDAAQSWKSNAIRPIVRNKVVSIAAHATAKLIFPKVFAYNEQSEEQEKSAMVMRDLIEWASEQNNYDKMSLFAVINACVNPASIMHVEYAEAYRTVKTDKGANGKWNVKEIIDETNSGFSLTPVPVDELYIADFYIEDIQKQPYLIWRRVQSYSMMKAKYGHFDNFKYVKPGVQVIYNDANTSFYEVYDSNLRGSLCEEVIFYSKPLDLQLVLVNGVLLTDCDEPNPRIDKQYPFAKFFYEPFDEGRAFYGKSLAFKMQPDADIINTLYPMIIDGTFLNIFNPLIVSGEEEIGSEVMIPGTTTTLINPDSSVLPLRVAQDIRQGMETLSRVEDSINQSSEQPLNIGDRATAYQISKIDQERQTTLGLFVTMIGDWVRQYGNLVKSDICQYVTIPQVNKIIDNGELIYKTIIVHDKQTDTGKVNRSIKFDLESPTKPLTEDEELKESYDVLESQGGADSGHEICRVNPQLFRNLKYQVAISPDILAPMSDDLERAYGLELFDRAIQGPALGVNVDMEKVFKDFLFKLYPKSSKDVNKYFKGEELQDPNLPQMNPQAEQQIPGAIPQKAGVTTGPAMPNMQSVGPTK
jgi:hypothetical protein